MKCLRYVNHLKKYFYLQYDYYYGGSPEQIHFLDCFNFAKEHSFVVLHLVFVRSNKVVVESTRIVDPLVNLFFGGLLELGAADIVEKFALESLLRRESQIRIEFEETFENFVELRINM